MPESDGQTGGAEINRSLASGHTTSSIFENPELAGISHLGGLQCVPVEQAWKNRKTHVE
jgi:hypothetical protein